MKSVTTISVLLIATVAFAQTAGPRNPTASPTAFNRAEQPFTKGSPKSTPTPAMPPMMTPVPKK
jgi:hypothetical protein